jgi:regulator of protease activity HflC (stomatin/prohibitin superfamily)
MNGFDLFGSLIQLGKDFFYFFLPFTILDYYEKGILLRLGNPRRRRKVPKHWFLIHPIKFWKTKRVEDSIIGPGFIWHLPFKIDVVISTNIVFETQGTSDLQVETKDGIPVNGNPVLGYSIVNVRKFLLEVEDASDAVIDAAGGAVVEAIRKKTWQEIQDDTEFVRKIRDIVARRANDKFGINVETLYFHSLVRVGLKHGVVKVIN